MDEFPGNSNKGKDAAVQKPEKPKVEKVTTEAVIVKKRGLGHRFKEVFLGGDAQSAGSYIVMEVLLPALRDMIVDATSKGVERMIYGDRVGPSRSRRNDGRPTVSYNRVSTRRDRGSALLPDQPSRSNRTTQTDDIILASREEADLVIERMTDIIDQFDVATVADLHELVGLPTTFVDNKWGWSDFRYVNCRQIRDGYLLELPRMEPL